MNEMLKVEETNKEIILSDFFDTIVHRRVSANDIKKMWAKGISIALDFRVDSHDVYCARIDAEHSLEDKYGYTYTYFQLIEAVYNRLFDANSLSESVEVFYNKVSNIEFELEKNVLYLDEENCNFIKQQKENGKLVYIVSDYHMSKDILKEYLRALGIDYLFSEIYVSCDEKTSKFDGTIYKSVLNKLGVNPEKCLMLGDNIVSDVTRSKENGITAVFRENKHIPQDVSKASIENILKAQVCRKDYSGYAYSLTLFIEKLYKQVKREEIEKVFFLSREGEFLKRLFDAYLERVNDTELQTNYLFVSRKSTFVASLDEDLDKESFFTLFRQYNKISSKNFMKNIGFSDEDIETIVKEVEIDIDVIIENFSLSEEMFKLKSNKAFRAIYYKTVHTQKKLFKKYLEQKGYESGKSCIVDVGWKGTIQDNIFRILLDEEKLYGFYVGYGEIGDGERSERNIKRGLIFTSAPYRKPEYKFWTLDAGMYEKILYASHPSTDSYDLDGNIVVPIFKKFDAEQGIYNLMKPIQDDIYEISLKIFDVFNNSAWFIEDFERLFLELHVDTTLTLNSSKINLRKKVEESHFENFGTFDTVEVGKSSAEFSIRKNFRYFVRRLKKLIAPDYFIINSYHFSSISSELFWCLYSYIVRSRAMTEISKLEKSK